MILGNTECDYDTAYFLKYGEYPKVKKCKQGLPEINRSSEIWDREPEQYILYRGWRMPDFFYN